MDDILGFQMNPEGDKQDIFHILREANSNTSDLNVINIWEPIPTELPKPNKVILTGSTLTLGEAMPDKLRSRSEIIAYNILSLIQQNVPVLGVCYSSQLLANELWPGSVTPTDKWNIGRVELVPVRAHPIFDHSQDHMSITVSYKERLSNIPKENVLATDMNGEILAYEYGSFIGLLGHPEIPINIIGRIISQRKNDPRYPNINVVELTDEKELNLTPSIRIIKNFLQS